VKSEPATPKARAPKRKKVIMDDSSSDDDMPLASSPGKPRTAAVPMPGAVAATTVPAAVNGNGKSNGVKSKLLAEDSDDASLPNGRSSKAPPKKKVKKEESNGEDSVSDERPLSKKVPTKKRKVKVESDADDDAMSEDEKPKKRAPKKAAKKVKEEDEQDAKPAKKGKVKEETDLKSPKKKKKEEKEPEDVYKWWEEEEAQAAEENDGSVKWKTLEHNGVLFPPPYAPLPPHVKMKYNGTRLDPGYITNYLLAAC
jgi:DNA topoisomerase I